MKAVPPPRLALLRAARAPVALILRRGPSRWVEAIRWDLTSDRFERGHWFHGRIYDGRSDLSPDGELFVYFASQFTGRTVNDPDYTYAWTAVSRVPWLTALALWPKGDCWWGGGLFTGPRALWLNHRPEEATPHPKHQPRGLTVEPNPEASGEDEPVYRRRLERDGWALRHEWQLEWHDIHRGYETLVPEERVKAAPRHPAHAAETPRIVLTRRLDNLKYREHFRVEGARSEPELPPGPLEWLDWDARGRLLALSGGRAWAAEMSEGRVSRFAELLDLRGHKPEERTPPEYATRW
jgi:hypothetical protein